MTVQAAGKRTYTNRKPRMRGRVRKWTDAEKRHLKFLLACGYRGQLLANNMNDCFGEGFTVSNCYQHAYGMGITDIGNNDKRGPYEQTYLMRATLEHLLDLKRAGHSPTRTELNITRDNCVKRIETVIGGSYIGSSAQMCADNL